MNTASRLHDPQRCFTDASYGISTGLKGSHACTDHLADMIGQAITRSGGPVLVYVKLTPARCDYRFAVLMSGEERS